MSGEDDDGKRSRWREVDELIEIGRRATSVVRRDGLRVAAAELAARGSATVLEAAQPFRISARRQDLLAPITMERPRAQTATTPSNGPLTLNWVTNPLTEPSGGMSTILQALALLEARGHTCRIYVLYKGTRRRIDQDRAACRSRFPNLQAEIADVDDGMAPADGIVATAWPTVYTVRAAPTEGVRFYFVCDFEPWFYPAGSDATLAEATYRFGLHGITLGPWLSQKLSRDYGMACDHFEFGVDLECYHPGPERERAGVVFYARPSTPRRGFEIGMMALEVFARRHPNVEIHTVGQTLRWRRPTFRYTDHGVLPPEGLAELYRRCTAGLVLSMSNLSLMPAEQLACGLIPVMNDAEFTRASCDDRFARFALPTPEALAEALGEVVDHDPGAEVRKAAAASVASFSWAQVGDQLEAAVRRGLELAVQR